MKKLHLTVILITVSATLAALALKMQPTQPQQHFPHKNPVTQERQDPRSVANLAGNPDPAIDTTGADASPTADSTPADAILASLKNLPELLEKDDGSGAALLHGLRGLAMQDPDGTLQWILGNLEGESRQRAMEEVFGIWADESPESALAWLEQQDKSLGWEGAVSTSLAAMAHKNAPTAATWLEKNPDFASRENLEILISRWGDTNPDQALSWVTKNLEVTMRDALNGHLLSSLRTDAATATILANTSPERRDAALAESSHSLSQVDARFALKLAGQIQEPGLRNAVESGILADAAAQHSSVGDSR